MDDHQSWPRRTARQAAIRRLLLPCLAGLLLAGAARADNESQRLGAEVLILAGDARRLAAERMGSQEHAGLQDRLAGELAALPLLLRRTGQDADVVTSLRTLLAGKDWKKFGEKLRKLGSRYRFSPAWISKVADPERVARGAELHRTYCAGCHESDWADTRLPAKPLSRMASSQTREEFAARLWLGVRGTREIAYANPFDDEELAALFAYYRSP